MLFIENNILITKQEIKQAIYKIALNKISKFNKITNRVLQYLVSIILIQIKSFFIKYIKKKI